MSEIETKIMKVKLSDIVFNEDVYARFKPDQTLIAKYEENAEIILESADKIKISYPGMILIDGYHRLKAFDRRFGSDFEFDICAYLTEDNSEIFLESASANEKFGKSNSKEETFRNIRRLYSFGFSLDLIQKKLYKSKAYVNAATVEIRKEEKAEMERKAVEMYLQAWNTQQSIAEELGVSQKTISDIINVSNLANSGQITKEWNLNSEDKNHDPAKPILYNIWKLAKQDNQNSSHFGAFPQIFMENLLWYYTEPLDIVFDPFAGGGTTIDACKSMFRRYYCTDI